MKAVKVLKIEQQKLGHDVCKIDDYQNRKKPQTYHGLWFMKE